ncbi:lipopolysaccharide biosynthesis [Acidothermus cellulolyticus 11B]|uniref:Lipopolysaccharide biosynthesis n=1 Tax=Acidothermus cellulolyticus (strain ATCC 43068 / DSM 8971 / 11B) TaxID=351607 RepID=A0LW90_ACIC1|nr:hypothetical protein [Acidothermus cellulolyticus]ABK53700.1 lipopolysaccharide biosynthesis [Acidothermus cellulolyticus 11B]
MSLGSVVAVMVRRWYLLLAVVVLAAVGAVGTYRLVSPPYRMTGQVLLLPTARSAAMVLGVGGDAANPYLALTPGLAQTGQVIAVATMDQQVAARLASQGFVGTYVLTEITAINAPVVAVTVTGPTPAAAAKDLRLVIAEFERQLQQAQQAAGAPSGTLIRATLLTQDTTAHPVNKSRLRDGIAVGAVIIVLGALFIAWLERRSRSARHRGEHAGEAEPTLPGFEGGVVSGEVSAGVSPRVG